jgi:hypothetical protein
MLAALGLATMLLHHIEGVCKPYPELSTAEVAFLVFRARRAVQQAQAVTEQAHPAGGASEPVYGRQAHEQER